MKAYIDIPLTFCHVAVYKRGYAVRVLTKFAFVCCFSALKVGAWIQVDFNTPTFITGIVTQGRPQGSPQWVTSYKISYGNSTNQMRVIQENGSDLVSCHNNKIITGM